MAGCTEFRKWDQRCPNGGSGRHSTHSSASASSGGSAERSCDIEAMKEEFYTISEGGYSNLLFDLFGKERVEAELDEFFQHDFIPRFGGGIGMTRIISALRTLDY